MEIMARGLNPRQIEAFRAVMQTGTVTAAADVLHTTQPSVSRLLAQLAYETRLKLFDHHHGRLRPTPEGLVISPTIPASWDGFTMDKTFRGKRLHIVVDNTAHHESGVKQVLVNGTEVSGVLTDAVLTDGAEIKVIM